jgi:hypothetical protein
MLDRFRSLLRLNPSPDKAKSITEGERQFNLLPPDIQNAITKGTEEQYHQAILDIRSREALQGVTLLGNKGTKYVYDLRHAAQNFPPTNYNK